MRQSFTIAADPLPVDVVPRNEPVEVTLEGGPPGISHKQLIDHATLVHGKIKIALGAGVEHFLRAGPQGSDRWVFRWAMRTKIAE